LLATNPLGGELIPSKVIVTGPGVEVGVATKAVIGG
jgi:hypothetical protein